MIFQSQKQASLQNPKLKTNLKVSSIFLQKIPAE